MKQTPSGPFNDLREGAANHLFESSINPIILTDQSGTILHANERAFELLGQGREGIMGREIGDLFESKQHLPDFSAADENEKTSFDGLMPTRENKRMLHVKVHATQYSLDGTPVVQWIVQDLTRQVELDELREDLAAMLVHDLQGPLGNVLSSLEFLRNEVTEESSKTMRLMLDTALRSSLHLKYLVDSLMDISHLEAGYELSHLTSIAVGDLIAYVCAVEEPNLEQKGITISVEAPRSLPEVWGDGSMLRRVLLNLLDNAIKYSQRGHVVTVRAAQEANGDMIRFAVIDQGQGVPEAYRDLIFEKFQQIRTNSSSGGLGLGLAFCRLAVEAHEGRIWVEDAPSGGAAFCFTIPTRRDQGGMPADGRRS